MFRFKDLKIGVKLIISITLTTVIVIILISTIISEKVHQLAENNAQIIVRETGFHYANAIKNHLEDALNQAKALGQVFKSLAQEGKASMSLTRSEVNHILQDFIESNPNFKGVYVLFEPNAFDGKDAEFIGQPGHDNTGRFIPYWSLDERGKGTLEPSTDYNEEGKGDYYLIPKKTRRETVTDPYEYSVRGKATLVTSLVVPLLDQQKNFIGAVGIDLDMHAIQTLIRSLKLVEYERAYATFYSPAGIVVSNIDSSTIGKNAENVYSSTPQFLAAVLGKESVLMKRYSPTLKEVVVSFVANLEIGNTGGYWAVAVNIPEKDLKSPVYHVIMQIIGVGIAAVLIIVLVVYFMARQISKVLQNLVGVSQAITAGQLDNVITITHRDEIGQLLSAFQVMQNQLRERFEADKRIATEMNTVTFTASQGDFSQRVSLEDKTGVFKTLSESINRVLAFNQLAIKDLTRVFSAVAQGDLTQTIVNDYSGELGQLKRDANTTVQKLTTVTEEISLVTEAAARGDFNQRVNLEDKQGTFKTIGESINRVLVFNQLAIKDLTRVFSAVAQGNLTQTITNDYSGELSQLKQDANATVNKLTTVTEEISVVTESAAKGDFSKRVGLENKPGIFKNISESINRVLVFNQLAIKDLTRVFSAVAQGDLTQTVTNDYAGELEQLKHDANSTVKKLTAIVTVIWQSAEIVNLAAAEISQGNDSLSQRTTQQAASLEETASSMEQMTSTVQQNADNAKHANQLAARAKEGAEQGNRVVKEAILAINQIHQSSKKIADIITVIDEIAFQTNLLALNAAVEAARAGDQGRGFAVVATEVRNLAQRSAGAAKEIKSLIQDSNTKVEEGTRLAKQSGQALEEIVISVKKVNDIIEEIAAASIEQSTGIAQVNQAVSQMDTMVEQNSALVEQASAASQSMKEQAQELKKQVAFFNRGEIEPAAPTFHTFKPSSAPPTAPSPKSARRKQNPEERTDWKDF